ncbi:MAG: FAD-binding protein, partial [Actinobacteria bacterium]|nr:FAD-binding protein [Actinomycetota bacterium]
MTEWCTPPERAGRYTIDPTLGAHDDAAARELRRRLPATRIQTDRRVLASYAQDRAVFESAGETAALVVPRSTDEVVAAVRAANAADVPVVPRGAGSGLTGGANAIDGCLLLSLHRMDEIVDVDTTNRMARVQPGVINADLKQA